MRTVRTKVFNFEELSKEAKDNAIASLAGINVDNWEWWMNIDYDAKHSGIEILSFDTDTRDIKGNIANVGDCINLILSTHGEACNSFKIASDYQSMLLSADVNDECDLKANFKDAILAEYLNMLLSELEYLQTDEAIIETIVSNEYEFTADGNLFKS